MEEQGKIYFASDLHLGAPDYERSLAREKHFVRWLDRISEDAAELYLLGDIFDFWFEYKKAIPKGYVRILGKLAELADSGVQIHIFIGNHDMWQKAYFTEQFDAKIHVKPITRSFFGKKFYIGHGDGLGPGDKGYKFLKKIFRNPLAQWAFHRLHPNFGIGLAEYFSRKSRAKTGQRDSIDHGENEFLLIFCKEHLKEHPDIDYFVFGHRHLPGIRDLEKGKYYVNLGDWITHFTWFEIDGKYAALNKFDKEERIRTIRMFEL